MIDDILLSSPLVNSVQKKIAQQLQKERPNESPILETVKTFFGPEKAGSVLGIDEAGYVAARTVDRLLLADDRTISVNDDNKFEIKADSITDRHISSISIRKVKGLGSVLSNAQPVLKFDIEPVANSTNMLTSSAIYNVEQRLVPKQQDAINAGKFLVVGSNGEVTLANPPRPCEVFSVNGKKGDVVLDASDIRIGDEILSNEVSRLKEDVSNCVTVHQDPANSGKILIVSNGRVTTTERIDISNTVSKVQSLKDNGKVLGIIDGRVTPVPSARDMDATSIWMDSSAPDEEKINIADAIKALQEAMKIWQL